MSRRLVATGKTFGRGTIEMTISLTHEWPEGSLGDTVDEDLLRKIELESDNDSHT